jgi:D-xylose transport system substrate-binding protein
MRSKLLTATATGLLALAMTTACNDSTPASGTPGNNNTGGGKARVGIIMPDRKSSTRWTNDDPKYLEQAFQAAGVPFQLENAEGSVTRFQQIADGMINGGVTVLMIVNLDSGSARTVLQKAKAKGVKTIDYDRLTLNGGADYYISFDNNAVGNLQARGLLDCMGRPGARKVQPPIVAELNGSPNDNNATLFKAGYDAVLQPKYDSGQFIKGPDQSVTDWDAEKGAKVFAQMLNQQPKISGVLAANDGLADAVIKVLKQKNLAGKVPVTGQDATLPALQHILAGEQCMTVYKPIKPEASKAAEMAITLFKKGTPKLTGETQRIKDLESGAYVPAQLLTPQSISRPEQISQVLKDNFVDRNELCAGTYAALCAANGLS